MAVYPTIALQAYISNNWISLNPDVIGEIKGSYGILSNNKVDRIADVGELSFKLRNDLTCQGGVDNYYTPGHTDVLTGWTRGVKIRLRIIYGGDTITKWYGHIDSIEIDPENRTVEVTCLDYFDYFSNFRLNLVNVSTDQDLGDVVDLILSGMPIQPIHKIHNTSEDTFISAFDTIRDNTRALSELNKLALSEFGWIYLQHSNPTYDEILITEGRHTRNFLSNPNVIPINDFYLLNESSVTLLTEGDAEIILNATETDIIFDSNMTELLLSYGENLANKIIMKSYPRRVDATPQVLHSIGTDIIPLQAGGDTKTVVGQYRDPNQTAQSVAGKDMITPVSGSDNDYAMFTGSGIGYGSDITADLDVSTSYSATTVTYTLENTGGTSGCVVKLQSRGTGIYIDASLSYQTEDSTSLAQNGNKELSIDQKYQSNPYTTKAIADQLLTQLKNPIVRVDAVTFLANTNDQLMRSFIYMDIGALIYVKDKRSNTDSYFYVNGIEFSIKPGGIIKFRWLTTDALSLNDVYWILGTSALGDDTIVGF